MWCSHFERQDLAHVLVVLSNNLLTSSAFLNRWYVGRRLKKDTIPRASREFQHIYKLCTHLHIAACMPSSQPQFLFVVLGCNKAGSQGDGMQHYLHVADTCATAPFVCSMVMHFVIPRTRGKRD